MSASRTLCSRCTSHLTSSISHRPAAVARLTTLVESHEVPKPTATAVREASANSSRSHTSQPDRKPRELSRQRRLPRRQPVDHIALFNEIVSKPGENGGISKPVAGKALEKRATLDSWEVTAMINELKRQETKPVAEKIRVLREEIWPQIFALGRPLPKQLYLLSNEIVKTVSHQMVFEHHFEAEAGDYASLLRMSLLLGKSDLQLANKMIVGLCSIIQTEADYSRRFHALNEMVDLWKMVSQMGRPSQRNRNLRFVFPSPEELVKDIKALQEHRTKYKKGTFFVDRTSKAFSAIFNQHPVEHTRFIIPALLSTMAVMSDSTLLRPRRLHIAAPFLEIVRVALRYGKVDNAYIDKFLCDRPDTPVQDTIRLRLLAGKSWSQKVPEFLDRPDASWRQGLQSLSAIDLLSSYQKQARKAHKADNVRAIISIWQDLMSASQDKPKLIIQMRENPDFLDYWHFLWCASRRPDMLQETNDLMSRIGLEPTLKTYTAMMNGWKISKDAEKIEALWEMLIGAKVKLDTHAWTERISGLIELGKPEDGIAALVNMLKLWKDAVSRHAPHEAVQPTIEVFNGAFRGLIRRDKKAAFEVLEWAGREGIKPDVRTYNIILRETFREKEQRKDAQADVQNLLKGMAAQGIEPDNATFTIILEEVLGSLVHATAAEQVAAVNTVFADIEGAGLQPNMEIYGKMLFAVSSLSNGSEEAIEAVQKHMRQHGHPSFSPHMVLILIDRYLQRGQHDSTAIQKLLAKHGFTGIDTGDQRLWEHVLSAYAMTGDTARALTIYDELRQAGRPPTRLFCLRDLLIGLIEDRQMDDAKRVVDEVLQELLSRQEEVNERRWHHYFWHLAHAHGLLDMTKEPFALKRVVQYSH
ncbi:unnamed protein product [Clonostachys rosea]|uniref:Pentacotripeptide-repeat region of PRORP domain-containing protein n=1 Tax=Bionectria ochroleuca TaxID=29856 RepID=A0ABY6TPU6_BIOOC|nr:unnamed protein product [Clonostachys rosea]